jgi:hypothetical protein
VTDKHARALSFGFFWHSKRSLSNVHTHEVTAPRPQPAFGWDEMNLDTAIQSRGDAVEHRQEAVWKTAIMRVKSQKRWY